MRHLRVDKTTELVKVMEIAYTLLVVCITSNEHYVIAYSF